MDDNIDTRLKFIFGRRSIRVYRPGEISDDAVRAMLEAAMSAPSAAAKYPPRFVVIRNPATLNQIAEALPNGKMLSSAALGIVVCGDLEAAHDRQLSYLLQDCSAAIQNLLLAAHVLGLGACWLGVHPRAERMQRITEILALPQSVIPVAGIAIGYPGEVKEPCRHYHSASVHYEHW